MKEINLYFSKYIKIFFLLILSISIVYYFATLKIDIINTLSNLNISYLLASLPLFLLYFYTRSLSWHYILRSLKQNISIKQSISVWINSEIIRYIPGNVWSFMGRAYLNKNEKIGIKITSVCIGIEIIIMLFCTFIFSVPALLYSSTYLHKDYLIVFIVLILLIVFIISLLKAKISSSITRYSTIFKENSVDYKYLVIAIFIQLFAWIFFALGTLCILFNVISKDNLIQLFSITILSWMVGYLSFVTPMGFGVREMSFVVLASPIIGFNAVVISSISRLLLSGTEIINFIFLKFLLSKNILASSLKSIFVKHKHVLVLILCMLAYFSIFSFLTIRRHEAFATNFDLANMDQTVWNTINGRWFELSTPQGTSSRLAIHADFILILLAPLYLLWNDVRMLLMVQSFFIALSAVPIYLLSNFILKNKTQSVLLAVLFLLNPATQWANIYDFHPVTLAIPFLLFTYYFGFVKKWGLYWLFFALSLITKEEISLMLAIFGLILILKEKEIKVGVISMLIGIFWFPLMIFGVIPYFGPSGQHWAFDEWFKESKSGYKSRGMFSLLFLFIKSLFSWQALIYFYDLMKGYSFIPLLALPWFILFLPELGINLVSSFPAMKTISLHYQSGILPGLTLSLIYGYKNLLNFIQSTNYKFIGLYRNKILTYLSAVILSIAIFVSLVKGPFPTNPSCWCEIYRVRWTEKEFKKIIDAIPKDAVISASNEIRPHLTHRLEAYNIPYIPDSVDYVALIDQQRYVGNFSSREYEKELIKEFQYNDKFMLVSNIGHYYLYKKVK